jgi:hypothetical protein
LTDSATHGLFAAARSAAVPRHWARSSGRERRMGFKSVPVVFVNVSRRCANKHKEEVCGQHRGHVTGRSQGRGSVGEPGVGRKPPCNGNTHRSGA